MPPRFVYDNDLSLDQSVALTATVSGLTHFTNLTENDDALTAAKEGDDELSLGRPPRAEGHARRDRGRGGGQK